MGDAIKSRCEAPARKVVEIPNLVSNILKYIPEPRELVRVLAVARCFAEVFKAPDAKGHWLLQNLPIEQVLDFAAKRLRSMEVIDWLIRHSGVQLVNGGAALFLATEMGQYSSAQVLLTRLTDIHIDTRRAEDHVTPLLIASTNGCMELVELLLQHNADKEAANQREETPLYLAAGNGHKEVVELLLVKGAKLEAADKDARTPLHKAADNGHKEVVELLLAGGAKLEAADHFGCTPLHMAVLSGHEVAELLLAKGANLEAADKIGFTPLHRAAVNGHNEVVELLLARGAKLEAADQFGRTPLYLATRNGHKEVVELLLAGGAKLEGASKETRR